MDDVITLPNRMTDVRHWSVSVRAAVCMYTPDRTFTSDERPSFCMFMCFIARLVAAVVLFLCTDDRSSLAISDDRVQTE